MFYSPSLFTCFIHLLNEQSCSFPKNNETCKVYKNSWCPNDRHLLFSIAAGAGANMEASVVFSPASFLPRSVMTNLTVHLMGQAINLLEASLWIYFFFIPLLKGHLVYWSKKKYFLISHYSSFSKVCFSLLQQSCLRLMTPLCDGLSHNKTTFTLIVPYTSQVSYIQLLLLIQMKDKSQCFLRHWSSSCLGR